MRSGNWIGVSGDACYGRPRRDLAFGLYEGARFCTWVGVGVSQSKKESRRVRSRYRRVEKSRMGDGNAMASALKEGGGAERFFAEMGLLLSLSAQARG